jgi:predicted RNase H-like nuclease
MQNSVVNTLVIGFDSAWTAHNRGALVAAIRQDDKVARALGPPLGANFLEAGELIRAWQRHQCPDRTVIFLDQPAVVTNNIGRRHVEQLVAPSVSRRRGGMQPANTGKGSMFGRDAPVWSFIESFGGVGNPRNGFRFRSGVHETYPVLVMIALGWTLPDEERGHRLPKYNPDRSKTFQLDDWSFVCEQLLAAVQLRGLYEVVDWLAGARHNPHPRKPDQDRLDACICLVSGLPHRTPR